MNIDKLKIIPLGGLGEVGKNMTLLEYGEDIIVIDCGLIFPDEDMLGIDLVIPDMSYLDANADRLRAFFITHGHEDHIGALPYALKKYKNVPVFGTDLTLALIKHKLDEVHIDDIPLRCVKPGDIVDVGDNSFTVEFIKSNHSIAGATALAITTPVGYLIHTGDFKVDFTPIDGEPIDITRLAEYGRSGVLALLSDSTNAELEGFTPSESEIGDTFKQCFECATGRVIVASFASNIYRIQQVADFAVAAGRRICFQGRSMIYITRIAMELGYLSIDETKIVDLEELDNFKANEICVITTGSQGEPMSGLFRMANSSHKLNIGTGDTVIISASAIPGNEVGVAKVINQLYQKGADVVYDPMADVHVSGHARRGELRLMLSILKPKYFIPVHGEQKQLHQHASLARDMGIPSENIFIMDIGDVLEVQEDFARISGNVPCGSVLVDGSGIGDVGNSVLKDRRTLSQDGIVIASIVISKTGMLLSDPDFITKGFVYEPESDALVKLAKETLRAAARKYQQTERPNWGNVKNGIQSELKTLLRSQTKRNPMIFLLVTEV